MALNNCLLMVSERVFFKTHKLKAFTLAEVLITLVIIGVIAAMTIPTLMNNTNKQEYVSKLKKTYSTLAQATRRIIADEGMPRGDMGGWATSAEAVFNMYKKYLSNAKVCGVDTTGCFQGTYKRLDNGSAGDFDTNKYTLVISDGAEVSIAENQYDASCSARGSGTDKYCQTIVVDINGAKKPNIVGRDVFAFHLKADGLVPAGCDYDPGAYGWGCACKVLREGAINY